MGVVDRDELPVSAIEVGPSSLLLCLQVEAGAALAVIGDAVLSNKGGSGHDSSVTGIQA
jgi:hypothetical protein